MLEIQIRGMYRHSSFFLSIRADIHQPLLSHLSLLVEFFIEKVSVNNKDSKSEKAVAISLCVKKERTQKLAL